MVRYQAIGECLEEMLEENFNHVIKKCFYMPGKVQWEEVRNDCWTHKEKGV